MEAKELIAKIKDEAGWFCMDEPKDKANFVKWIRKNSSLFPDVEAAVKVVTANDSWCTDSEEDLNSMFRRLDMPIDDDYYVGDDQDEKNESEKKDCKCKSCKCGKVDENKVFTTFSDWKLNEASEP